MKEAIILFGEKFLAREINTKQLKKGIFILFLTHILFLINHVRVDAVKKKFI